MYGAVQTLQLCMDQAVQTLQIVWIKLYRPYNLCMEPYTTYVWSFTEPTTYRCGTNLREPVYSCLELI